jgi:hypothetical protein
MHDVGYEGTLDIPDDPLPPHMVIVARCLLCGVTLSTDDEPDCGDTGCPWDLNETVIGAMRDAVA